MKSRFPREAAFVVLRSRHHSGRRDHQHECWEYMSALLQNDFNFMFGSCHIAWGCQHSLLFELRGGPESNHDYRLGSEEKPDISELP